MYILGQYYPRKEEVTTPGMRHFFGGWYFQKEHLKIRKTNVESYICDNLSQICRFFFIFNNKKNFEIHLAKKSSGRQEIDFFRTCMIILCWY